MSASFEAKLHGFRRTQDGVVISYVIHPNDLSSEMALAPLGTRYMVAFAEIGDDGHPTVERPTPEADREAAPAVVTAGETAPRDRKPFASLPLAQQAAIRCQDNEFKLWLNASNADDAAERVRQMCGVGSRAALTRGSKAGGEWLRLEAEYQAYLTDRQYAGSVRA